MLQIESPKPGLLLAAGAECSDTGQQWSQVLLPGASPVPLVFLSSVCHKVNMVCHVYLKEKEREKAI